MGDVAEYWVGMEWGEVGLGWRRVFLMEDEKDWEEEEEEEEEGDVHWY